MDRLIFKRPFKHLYKKIKSSRVLLNLDLRVRRWRDFKRSIYDFLDILEPEAEVIPLAPIKKLKTFKRYQKNTENTKSVDPVAH